MNSLRFVCDVIAIIVTDKDDLWLQSSYGHLNGMQLI